MVWQLIGVVQMTINSVNVMEWRQWFSSLFCSLFCFWTCHLNLLVPCILCHFHEHQIGIGGNSCYAHIPGRKIRLRERLGCTMDWNPRQGGGLLNLKLCGGVSSYKKFFHLALEFFPDIDSHPSKKLVKSIL